MNLIAPTLQSPFLYKPTFPQEDHQHCQPYQRSEVMDTKEVCEADIRILMAVEKYCDVEDFGKYMCIRFSVK